MVTTRYSDQQGSKSRQTIMRLCLQAMAPTNQYQNGSSNNLLRPSLMGPKSRILEIWNRAIFGFQDKILSYGLEIGPFSRIWFSRIGRGRQILENGHPFSREIGLSGKWSLCYMVRLLAMPRVFVWLLILVAVEQIYDQITRRLVAQRVAPAARVILSQTPSFRRWRLLMETMAYWQQVSLSLSRCSYLFELQRPRTLVPTGPT